MLEAFKWILKSSWQQKQNLIDEIQGNIENVFDEYITAYSALIALVDEDN